MVRLAAILILFVLACLVSAAHPVFAQDPPEQGSGGVSFPLKNDSNISQLLLDSIGDRGGAAIRSGAATKDTVTVDPDKDGSSVADGAGPGESGEVEAPQTVGDPVRFDSSGNVEVYIHLASTDEASLSRSGMPWKRSRLKVLSTASSRLG